MMLGESWKPVVDWPAYEVSTLGRVRRGGKQIRTFVVRGYLAFNVCDGAKNRKSLRVHVQVLKSHKRLPLTGEIGRHLNGNKRDCTVSNLDWGTAKQNEADKKLHGTALVGERHHQAKLTESDVIAIRQSNESGIVLAARYKVTPTTICSIRKMRIWRNVRCA